MEEPNDPVKALLREGNRFQGSFKAPYRTQVPGFAWEHEVRVWLPPSYESSEGLFPVAWVMDNMLGYAQSACSGSMSKDVSEFIVVSIGGPVGLDLHEFQRRRTYDFLPALDLAPPAFRGFASEDEVGGAQAFLDHLCGELRQSVADEYRVDTSVNVFLGHSGGAQLGLYSLFTEPKNFSHYILSSPGLGAWLNLEDQWFASNKDLPAKLFLGVGGSEWNNPLTALAQVISSASGLSERLTQRGCPSLHFDYQVLPGEDHGSVAPVVYSRGVRQLFRTR